MERKQTKTIKMKPEVNKCWQNKKGHKFIHTNGKVGLPLFVHYEIDENEEENKRVALEEFNQNYIQVNI
jgi:hypothetical protein